MCRKLELARIGLQVLREEDLGRNISSSDPHLTVYYLRGAEQSFFNNNNTFLNM